MFGLSVATTTPFTSEGEIDLGILKHHVVNSINSGAKSITFFGTTGEGPSLSFSEKYKTISYLIPNYLKEDQVVVAIICSNAKDVVSEINKYNNIGIYRFLISPPYFFGNISSFGLKEWFSEIFSRYLKTDNNFILYNIPQVTGVRVENNLISDLRQEFGRHLVYGVKDSSGSLESAKSYLQDRNLMVAIGDERLIADCMSLGASGSICGLSNIFPQKILKILETRSESREVNNLVESILKFPVTSGIKAALAIKTQNDIWFNVRSPLIRAPKIQVRELRTYIEKLH